MIYNLLSYIIYLFRYRHFNLAHIDQFSENVTNGGQRPRTCAYFKYSQKINRPTRNIMRFNIEIISLKKTGISGSHVTENGA